MIDREKEKMRWAQPARIKRGSGDEKDRSDMKQE